ncbi:MAG: phosphotransferase family protein [Anaerolineae bacterium]
MRTLIGTGARAKIYAEDGCAVKCYEPGYRKEYVFYEALINTLVESTGLPVPKVFQVTDDNQHLSLKMELIKGQTLKQALRAEPGQAQAMIAAMVRLQMEMHTARVELPFTLHQKLTRMLEAPTGLSASRQQHALELLQALPAGGALCHGDYHTSNILVQENKLYIVDWIDASTGCADGDVCRTYLVELLHTPEIAPLYLERYCRESGKSREAILRWLPVIASARLSDGIAGEQPRLLALLQDENPDR